MQYYGESLVPTNQLIGEVEYTAIRKGPWTEEEDNILFNYVSVHGEGRWNCVARYSGLKRTGKSCRLRWLNYLRPDVIRGNISLEEQLKILELHSLLGNRWSKIAQCLPGRTDNEIKNYWRTRVQKQAKQRKYDVNSQEFRNAMRNEWIPRLVERIQARSNNSPLAGQLPAHHPDPRPLPTPSLLAELSYASTGSPDTQVSDLTENSNVTLGLSTYLAEPSGLDFLGGMPEFPEVSNDDWPMSGVDTMESSLWNECGGLWALD